MAEYGAGETIFSQGEECTEVHYIRQGVVKLTLVSKRGRAGILGFLGRGDFFGEGCINSQTFHAASAVALVPSSVIVIDRDKMLRTIQDEPAACTQFINYLLARNHRIEQDLIDHLFNSSEKRLARTLLLPGRVRPRQYRRVAYRQDQPGHSGGDGGDDAPSCEFLYEQVPQTRLDPLHARRRAAGL